MAKYPKELTLRERLYIEKWAEKWGKHQCSFQAFHEALYAVYGVE